MTSKILIEVGAYDGEDSLIYYKNGYKVYSFEPHIPFYINICNKTKGLDGYNIYNKAVSLVDGQCKFNVCNIGGANSILEFRDNEHLKREWSENRRDILYSGKSYNIMSTRLDTFIEEENLTDCIIDYIHIDAQGVDLDVLKSMGKYIKMLRKEYWKLFLI